eukprot:4864780-Lingulodinium_polyedra.AAC.1
MASLSVAPVPGMRAPLSARTQEVWARATRARARASARWTGARLLRFRPCGARPRPYSSRFGRARAVHR